MISKTSALVAVALLSLSGCTVAPRRPPEPVSAAWPACPAPPGSPCAEGFETGLGDWRSRGLKLSPRAISGDFSAALTGDGTSQAHHAGLAIADSAAETGWRRITQASVAVTFVPDSAQASPGLGFASADGTAVYAQLNLVEARLEAHVQAADGATEIIETVPAPGVREGKPYRLEVRWSPFANALMALLRFEGSLLADLRAVVEEPSARYAFLSTKGGPARFDDLRFDPTLPAAQLDWEWREAPLLSGAKYNPAVWKWKDGRSYMMWRSATDGKSHGIASSSDGLTWEPETQESVLTQRGDVNVLVDPFGDGLVYATTGMSGQHWYTSDGSERFSTWEKRYDMKMRDVHGSRIQAIIDTDQYPQLDRVNGYRFLGFCEDWSEKGKPVTRVVLSNDLLAWELASDEVVPATGRDWWGVNGSAVGAAFVQDDGTIRVATCACTAKGYSGSSEATNVTFLVPGDEPWEAIERGVLPDVPVHPGPVWYEGPNFATEYVYDDTTDTLFLYGGFHDEHVGVLRVRGFRRGRP